MKSRMKLLAVVIALSAGGAFAEDKDQAPPPQDAPARAEKTRHQESEGTIEQTAKDDEQVLRLQSQVEALQREIAKAPQYPADPLADPLLP